MGAVSVAGTTGDGDAARAKRWLGGLSKSGSNSVAVAASRTDTGSALMANDPHLGILVPNVWLIAGIKSPSYHAVGLMAPGLPIFAIGRNPRVAWGGTNMRAASSDLFDVSDVPAAEIAERSESIGVRWWFDSDVTVRETQWGPIITDVPLLADMGLPPLALKWTGHDASDEIGAMLAVSRAQSFAEFRAAFDDFAVPGQNMLYADVDGNIGRVMAVRLPGRDGPPADIAVDTDLHDASWSAMRSAADLPHSYNPEAGYLVSANDRPPATDVPVGFFFSRDDRVDRMHALVAADDAVGVETLKALQQDVHMASSVTLRDLLVSRLDALGMAEDADARREDGDRPAARVGRRIPRRFDRGGHVRAVPATPSPRASTSCSTGRTTGRPSPPSAGARRCWARRSRRRTRRRCGLRSPPGLRRAADGLESFANWGEMHRLSLAHPLANVPAHRRGATSSPRPASAAAPRR